ncbi:MAG: hypothetical protein JWQ18_1348 [Conexibacter sp.]|nr:hypothetical protein [Conexibacter sp.]
MADADPPPAATPAPAPATAAQDQVTRWRGVIDAVRSRADLSAKALGAIGTTAITAIGIDRIQDLSPTDWNTRTEIWAVLAVFGFLLMAVVIAGFVRRLALVNEPVVMSTGESDLKDPAETAIVRRAFGDMAGLHQAPSLRAYEARAARLERIAARSDAARRTQLEQQAAEIRADVQATLGKAAADVLRRRSAQTFTGSWARSMYVLAVAGFVLFAVGTDYLDGDRGRQDAVAKARLANDKECAAALKAYSDQGLTVTLPADRRCPKAVATKR